MVGYRWNNFTEFFPGRSYRRRGGFKQNILKDLDRILLEMEFDIEGFQKLEERRAKIAEESIEMYRKS